MSQTHKGDRKKSGFEVEDHATILKNNIRELSLARNFGLKVRESRLPLSDLTNMVKSWTYSRREEMSYPQLRSIELTVLSIYGRKAYEQVYDHSERWKAT